MLKATVQGLQSLRRPDEVAATRGLTISQVLPVSAKKDEAEAATAAAAASAEPETTEKTEKTETTDGDAEDHADA
jgi:hypothetical protein